MYTVKELCEKAEITNEQFKHYRKMGYVSEPVCKKVPAKYSDVTLIEVLTAKDIIAHAKKEHTTTILEAIRSIALYRMLRGQEPEFKKAYMSMTELDKEAKTKIINDAKPHLDINNVHGCKTKKEQLKMLRIFNKCAACSYIDPFMKNYRKQLIQVVK